jgi:hypothetical protein
VAAAGTGFGFTIIGIFKVTVAPPSMIVTGTVIRPLKVGVGTTSILFPETRSEENPGIVDLASGATKRVEAGLRPLTEIGPVAEPGFGDGIACTSIL